MANRILPKRSYTSGSTPTTSDLQTNELAINWADGKAFTKNAAGNIVTLTMGGSGGGGLSWSSVPASATATGTAGQMAYDGSYVYVCVQTNVWVRSPLATWAVDAYPTSTSLLLHFDGSINDSSLTPKTVTAVGNAAATGAAKYGSASLALDGDGDGLTLSDGLPRDTEDFTVEFWVYKSSNWTGESSNRILYEWADNSMSGGVSCYLNSTSNVLRVGRYAQANWYMDYAASNFAANTWYHIAVTRNSSTLTLWVNGSSAVSSSYSGGFGSNSGLQSIGCGSYMGSYGASSSWPGRIDDFRVTRGVARYTSTFTPPTIAHPDPIQPPVISISAQPSSQAASSGAATFSVTASVTLGGSLTYQWQKSTDSGSTFANVSGATSASLTLTSQTTSNNGNQYRVVVSSTGATSVTSSAATLTVAASFTATAVLLTSGTSYTVPANASNVKAWSIGGGGANGGLSAFGGAGGTAYKTWSVSSGSTISYTVGAGGSAFASTSAALAGGNTTVTYNSVTITGFGGGGDVNGSNYSGGSFSGGDGGASGGNGVGSLYGGTVGYGGAVGGNGTPVSPCNRKPMTDISGLLAALSLAGVSTTETCATSAAFGSGAAGNKFGYKTAGLGGGGAGVDSSRFSWNVRTPGGAGAVVLYFT